LSKLKKIALKNNTSLNLILNNFKISFDSKWNILNRNTKTHSLIFWKIWGAWRTRKLRYCELRGRIRGIRKNLRKDWRKIKEWNLIWQVIIGLLVSIFILRSRLLINELNSGWLLFKNSKFNIKC
jgi:hypothetical protein